MGAQMVPTRRVGTIETGSLKDDRQLSPEEEADRQMFHEAGVEDGKAVGAIFTQRRRKSPIRVRRKPATAK